MPYLHYLLPAALTLFTTVTHAELINRNNGMVYDSVLDITWLADANYAFTSGYDPDGLMTFQESLDWAEQLVYGGYSDWRVAKETTTASAPYCSDFNCEDTEYAHLYYNDLISTEPRSPRDMTGDQGPFTNIQVQYWTGISVSDIRSVNFHFNDGYQIAHTNETLFASWAVHDGDVAVPLPAAAWLLLSGLVSLGAYSRLFKKV